MLLGTLDASMLRNMITGKGVMRARKGFVRAGTGYNAMDHTGKKCLVPLHPLSSIKRSFTLN